MTHHLLSPSKWPRIINCPPSAREGEKYPDHGSVYAAEGTVAHALAEVRLGEALDQYGINCIWSHNEADTSSEYYCAAMEEHIAEYVTQVMERATAAENPFVMLEQQLHFSEYVPDGYGTGDVVILADDTLEIIDLKYGSGVPVDATRNPQLMLYGLGAYLTFGQLYDIKTVRVTVIQPRLDSTSSYDLSVEDLLSWAKNEVQPKAQLAWEGKGEFKAGEWCQFCPVAGDCRERARVNIELAKEAFKDPPTLTDDEIGELLTQLPEWKSWVKAFEARALQKALSEGAHYPGYKLVLGRSTRKYKNIDGATKALVDAGYSIDDVSPRELLGVTAMTGLLGKKKFKDILTDHIYMSPGKPTLVPESDKRKEYVPKTTSEMAADVFEGFNDNTNKEIIDNGGEG